MILTSRQGEMHLGQIHIPVRKEGAFWYVEFFFLVLSFLSDNLGLWDTHSLLCHFYLGFRMGCM